MMEQLKNMKCTLMNQVQAQLCNLQAVDAKVVVTDTTPYDLVL